MHIAELKKNIRQPLYEQRNNLSPQLQEQLAKNMGEQVIHHPLFLQSHSIAAFCAHNGEMSPALIIQRAFTLNKNCYFPALDPQQKNHLQFVQIKPDTAYHNNQYGIPEPDSGDIIPAWDLDLILLPLVAVDKAGNRLGMGGGFYDRTLNFKLSNSHKKKLPLLIGLAYTFQCVEKIPHDNNDVILDGIATEHGVILF